MTNPQTLPQRFINGQELTHHELQEAFKRMFGRPLPPRTDARKVARHLSAAQPLRFEFEVNRLRGFAWDNGQPPLCP